jgi:2-oxoglutarate ferredoxin oxidoreductase subunit delta
MSIKVREDRCKGCSLCTTACPKKIMEISSVRNKKGYMIAHCIDDDTCISCAMCAMICPDCAISVEK